MLLANLLSAAPEARVIASDHDAIQSLDIRGIAYDSRTVQPGDLFVALPGVHADGRQYIRAAAERGAVAVVVETETPEQSPIPHLIVPDARAAMADLSAHLYGRPSERLQVIGVTGTDGKTTTSFLLHALLQGTGHPAGLITTVAFRIGEQEWENESRQTTPEAPDIQRLLARMLAEGMTHVVLETSSHALMLDRVRGCNIDHGVFTNVTSDHLDFHKTIEEYRAAKGRLFEGLGQYAKKDVSPVAILNRDDASFSYMEGRSRMGDRIDGRPRPRILSYGMHPEADVRAEGVQVSTGGIHFQVVAGEETAMMRSPMTGGFNVHNLLAALAFGVAHGIPLADAALALGHVVGVPGRMLRLDAGQEFAVIVDYAHTPDGLRTVLDELRAMTQGRLIAVFGAAGERDRGKRPHMGRIAAERADLIVLTDEDPRLEDSRTIIEEIAVGAREAGARDETLLLIPDRREAIGAAMRWARPGDTVLLAGKGHESCIIVGTEKRPWNEEAEARAALERV